MVWLDPRWLWLLAALPVALAAVAWTRKRRAAERAAFSSETMQARMLPRAGRGRRGTRTTLELAGFGCLLAAAARPGVGEWFERVATRSFDLVVCLDVSRSMLAEDVAPTRLGRAKSDVLDLLERVEGDRVALVAFAGRAVTLCPLTTDQAFFRQALREAGPGSAPLGGSRIGDAVRAALDTLEPRPDADQAILVITDGEDQDSEPLAAAAEAAERGVRIFAVGLGDSEEGARIPITGVAGERAYLQHEGQEVWTRLDATMLREMTVNTGGAYVGAGTRSYDLGQVYEQHLAGLARAESESRERRRHHERFQWLLGAGLLMLVWSLALKAYDRPAAALPGGNEGDAA